MDLPLHLGTLRYNWTVGKKGAVVMGFLLIATMVAVSLTPEQEVEAWDPTTETVEPIRDPAPQTDSMRAWQAAGIVTIGVVAGGLGAGTIAGVGYTVVNTNASGVASSVGNVLVLVSALAFLTAVPTTLLALFADGLVGWAPWAAGAAVAAGTIAGLATGIWLGSVYLSFLAGQTSDDCIACGGQGIVGLFVLPIGLAFLGGASLGIGTTTMAAFSE